MLEGLKSMLFEGDGKKVATPSATSQIQAPVALSPQPMPSMDSNNDFYAQLALKTSFFSTPAGAPVSKYYEALAVLPDKDLRLKTAIAQAKHLDGLTDANIALAFDELLSTLQNEGSQFSKASLVFTQHEITERQGHIDELGVELRRIQEVLASETVKLAEARGQVASTESQFNSAITRRNTELAQEKEKFLALGKG
jgi:hypothetical protein